LLQRLKQSPPPLRSIKAGIPRALDAAVMQALNIEPSQRYASAIDMARALERAVTPDGSSSTQVIRATPASPRADTPAVRSTATSELRKIVPIIAFIVASVLVAFLIPRFLDSNEKKGSATSTTRPEGSQGGTGPIGVQGTTDFDPSGDGSEHPEEVAAATDGDPATEWSTEDYRDPLQTQKPGVGLIFDLGSSQEIARVQIHFGTPGVTGEVRAADSSAESETGFNVEGRFSDAATDEEVSVSATARYWLVWITSLPGGGAGRAAIGEVRFFAP
jgi:hypothetical protein